MPGEAETSLIHWVAGLLLLVVLLLLSFGGTIERMLEIVSVTMLVMVFSYLFVVNVFFVPWSTWIDTFVSFFKFSGLAGNPDWVLLGALAGSAAAGGLSNLTITNWMRDKGYGMGGRTGAIPSAFGGRSVQVSHFGKIFPVTPDSLKNWKNWWQYVHFDQVWLWAGGAFVGMFLNVNLALGVIPVGTEISGMAVGVYQAQYMAESLWTGFWALTLLNGFWVMFSTQLGRYRCACPNYDRPALDGESSCTELDGRKNSVGVLRPAHFLYDSGPLCGSAGHPIGPLQNYGQYGLRCHGDWRNSDFYCEPEISSQSPSGFPVEAGRTSGMRSVLRVFRGSRITYLDVVREGYLLDSLDRMPLPQGRNPTKMAFQPGSFLGDNLG